MILIIALHMLQFSGKPTIGYYAKYITNQPFNIVLVFIKDSIC